MFNEAGSSGTGSIPMQQVRAHSTSPAGEKAKPDTPSSNGLPAANAANCHVHGHEHANGVANGHEHQHEHHEHEHEHGLFGHSHAHGEEEGHGLIDALQSGSDKGARITVIGLLSNIVLTGAKGAAGWFMNSAALLAEAGHSFSDLLGDFVVLFSWRLSRRPPSKRYPFGLAKFETFGTTVVALLLISGGLGIGFHALSLLLTALSETAQTMAPGPLHTAIQNVTEVVNHLPAVAHVHSHSHAVPALDPNAAWFAAVSVLAKEWLFRITRRVAKEENSPVLMANAFHHRSDAYSSAVALVAIMGSTFFPALPLDPIGGVVVSIVIIQQGVSIFAGAFREITDASVSSPTLQMLEKSLDPLTAPSSSAPLASSLLAIDAFRARRAGSSLFVDLTAHVRPGSDVAALLRIEEAVAGALKGARKDVKDVVVRFREADMSESPPRILPTQSDGSQ